MSALIRTVIGILLVGILVACSSAAPGTGSGDDSRPSGPGAVASTEPDAGTDEDEPSQEEETSNGTANLGPTAACDLLSPEDVNEVLGSTAVNANGNGSNGSYACTYYDSAGSPVLGTTLTTGEMVGGVWAAYESDSSTEPVAGIGDGAIWYQGTVFMVRKGNAIVALQASVLDDEGTIRDSLTDLGRVVADSL